jgi:phospholipid/cholesterol/gamma-HCH transport system substrate-binding protein
MQPRGADVIVKLTIRFADQIVGGLIILALGILVFVIFMLGSSQRWFSRDYLFKTYFTSASGISQNMPVLYKGFTIGRVKNITLSEDDQVEVDFTIFDTYIDRVRQGSLVEVLISPIGMGNQFMFYPGLGMTQITEGGLIPSVSSAEGKRLLASGMALRPERDDSLNNIINRAGTLLATLNETLVEVQNALIGTDESSLGRTMGEVEMAARGLRVMSQKLPSDLETSLGSIMAQLQPILENLNQLSAGIANPDGSVMMLLDAEGPIYTELTASLSAISATLRNLEKTSDFIPAQLPQLAVLLSDLHATLSTAENVLTALANNPILKGGIPPHRESSTGGTRPRDVEF